MAFSASPRRLLSAWHPRCHHCILQASLVFRLDSAKSKWHARYKLFTHRGTPLPQRARKLYSEIGGCLFYVAQTWTCTCEAVDAIERFERSCWRSLLCLLARPDEPLHLALPRTHAWWKSFLIRFKMPTFAAQIMRARLSLAKRSVAPWAPSLRSSSSRMFNRQVSETIAPSLR